MYIHRIINLLGASVTFVASDNHFDINNPNYKLFKKGLETLPDLYEFTDNHRFNIIGTNYRFRLEVEKVKMLVLKGTFIGDNSLITLWHGAIKLGEGSTRGRAINVKRYALEKISE